jgi:hypothetical protein
VVAVGLVVGAWEVVRIIHRRRGVAHSYKQYYRPRLVLSVILLLFYLYPSVTNVAVGLLACSDVDTLHASNPKLRPEPAAAVYTGSYWMGETSVQCWTGPHLWMVVFLAIPYLLLFSLGFPLILVWRLYKHRYQLGCQSVSGGHLGQRVQGRGVGEGHRVQGRERERGMRGVVDWQPCLHNSSLVP